MKQKRYWLWGGVIGIIVIFLTIFIFIVSLFFSKDVSSKDFFYAIWLLFTGPGVMILGIETPSGGIINIPDFLRLDVALVSIIFNFLPGAFFGWFYGKIKNRNKNKEV